MQRAADRDDVVWPHFAPQSLGGAFDQDQVLPNAGGSPAGRFSMAGSGSTPTTCPTYGAKPSSDQSGTGAEIDQPVLLRKP